MKDLKRIRYFTANRCNISKAPAYNLKVYNVIDKEILNKVFELMDTEEFYYEINELIRDFDINNNQEWQAGFNGRSGGYLVLYKGGKNTDGSSFSYPGKNIEDNEVPKQVLKDFRQLALDIVKYTEHTAKTCDIKEDEYIITKTRKVIVEK